MMIKKTLTFVFFSFSVMSFAQQKFSIVPSVGYAWRTASMPKGISREEREYIKGLKSGVNFDVAAYYNLKNIGIGFRYSNYSASSDGILRVQGQNGNTVSANVSTKDHITFFGPSIMYSNYNEDTRHKLFMDFGLGVISYKTVTGSVNGKGSSLGLEADFGYQYAVTDNILIGPKLGFTAGTLSSMTFNGTKVEFPEDQKEGLHRVSLSAAVSFRF
ncbi:hypothetical protein [Chryseobacterium phocaeense]|uniref:hypothetical protein n=1 Tax=Chryseobacterium phocaeense TaxID=1816690 RepID=UPI0009B9E7DA|nr:hypothetical protein [Chryseobacterium phocaeense]